MAAEHVEARSLAAINYIADNPPPYPHWLDSQPSLVLYISKVPGSQGKKMSCKNIILSTIKPKIKTVSDEDIRNALYYVHLDSPSDKLLAAPLVPAEGSPPRCSPKSTRSVIPRKPVPVRALGPDLNRQENGPPPLPAAPALAQVAVSEPVRDAPPGHEEVQSSLRPRPESQLSASSRPASTHPSQTIEELAIDYRPNPMVSRSPTGSPSRHEAAPPVPPRHGVPLAAQIQRKPLDPTRSVVFGQIGPVAATQPPQTPSRRSLVFPRAISRQDPAASPNSFTSPHFEQAESPSRLRTPSPTQLGRQASGVAPLSLTLIRKDPASKRQWNVAKIFSFQTNMLTPDRASPDLDPRNMCGLQTPPKIHIHVETSGYAKFRGLPTRQQIEAFRPASAASGQEALREFELARLGVGDSQFQGRVEGGFQRQLLMTYGQGFTGKLMQAFIRRKRAQSAHDENDGSGVVPPRLTQAQQRRVESLAPADSVNWINGNDGDEAEPLITEPGLGLKPKGFVFMSPWDGRCEFRTGNAGRSVTCRHALDTQASIWTASGIKAAAQGLREARRGRSGSQSAPSVPRPVSELRFNLPSRDVFSRSPKEHSGRDLTAQFHKLLRLEPQDSSDEDYDGPLDLSLGREKAGGGHRGTKVKLGKLIIHDEGFKMLDLAVAANVGVWWTVWEREKEQALV